MEVDHGAARRERDDGVTEQRSNYDYRRGDDEDRFVGEWRDPILLGENLDHIGQNLQQSERADAVRPIPVLPQGQQPSLQPDQAGADGHRDEEHAKDDQQRLNDFIHTRKLTERCIAESVPRAVASVAPTEGYLPETRSLPLAVLTQLYSSPTRQSRPRQFAQAGRQSCHASRQRRMKSDGQAIDRAVQNQFDLFSLIHAQRVRGVRVQRQIRLRRPLRDAVRQGAERLRVEDVIERRDQPYVVARSRRRRRLVDVCRPLHLRGIDQVPARIAAAQRPAHFALELVERLHGVPTRRPEASDERRRRLALITLHREGERRVGVIWRLRLVNRDVREHRRAPAVTLWLSRYFLALDAEVRRGRDFQDRLEDRKLARNRRSDVIQVVPYRGLFAPGGDHQVAQPAPALTNLALGRKDLVEALRAPFVIHKCPVAFGESSGGKNHFGLRRHRIDQ